MANQPHNPDRPMTLQLIQKKQLAPINIEMSRRRAVLLKNVHDGSISIAQIAEEFSTLKRKQAYQVLPWLPYPLRDYRPVDMNDDTYESENVVWGMTAAWLLYWETEDASVLPILQNFKPYEIRAQVSRRRYEMIQALIDRQCTTMAMFKTAAVPFLLAEFATVRQQFNGWSKRGEGQRGTGKRPRYQHEQQRIRRNEDLKILNIEAVYLEDSESLVVFDRIVEAAAGELAKTDSAFNRLFWNGYWKAQTTWNKLLLDPKFKSQFERL
jgi:hypothetical protein